MGDSGRSYMQSAHHLSVLMNENVRVTDLRPLCNCFTTELVSSDQVVAIASSSSCSVSPTNAETLTAVDRVRSRRRKSRTS